MINLLSVLGKVTSLQLCAGRGSTALVATQLSMQILGPTMEEF